MIFEIERGMIILKLCELKIKNFCCISNEELTIKIDNIVILIGPNNVGKSTVFKAYEAFASSGSSLSSDNFHKYSIDVPVEITGTFCEISEEDITQIGRKWIYPHNEYGDVITYKWKWNKPDSKGEKYSWDNVLGWQTGGMGGWDSKIASCIPVPLKINPFDDSKTLEDKIIDILTEAVKKSVQHDGSKLQELIGQLNSLAESVKNEISESLTETTSRVTTNLSSIFKDYKVEIKPEAGKFDADKIIASGSHIRILDPLGGSFPLRNQGTGLQRAFLWSALESLTSGGNYKIGKKPLLESAPRILLIEEPEAFLHPPAIREARESLYKIAQLNNWQVMITTHSPIFIDVSKPHTTIIRVEMSNDGHTKTFSTDKVGFDENERKRLQMIRSCHPTINEFFFAEKIYLVEGETELAVLSYFRDKIDENNIQIVNCFGKANIPMFQRILNQFGVNYIVIHDIDSPKCNRKDKWISNPMWKINETIFNESRVSDDNIVIANFPDFEGQYFGYLQKGDKPYNALVEVSAENFHQSDSYSELIGLFNKDKLDTHRRKILNVESFEKIVNENIDFNKVDDPLKWFFE